MKLSQVVIVMGLVGLAGCSSGERDMRLHYLKTNSGTPEEFAIVPNKPLETPPAMNALPAPFPWAVQPPQRLVSQVPSRPPGQLPISLASQSAVQLANRLAGRRLYQWQLITEDGRPVVSSSALSISIVMSPLVPPPSSARTRTPSVAGRGCQPSCSARWVPSSLLLPPRSMQRPQPRAASASANSR